VKHSARTRPARPSWRRLFEPERLEWVAAALLTAIALVLHIMRARHGGGLWRDETAAINLATAPSLGDVWEGTSFEIMPVGPLLLFRAWAAGPWGEADLALRALGALIGAGLLAALWWQARTVTGKAPLLSVAALGLCAPVLHWGDSLRGYGLAMVSLAVTFALFWRMVEAPTARRVALAAAAAVASAQCAYQNAPLVAAIGAGAAAVALARRRPRRAALLLAAGIPAALSLVPYALGPLHRAEEWTMVVKSPTTAAGIARLAREEFTGADIAVWLGLVAASAALGGWALVASRRAATHERRDLPIFAGVTLVAGVAGVFAFTWRAEYRQFWHFLPALALVAMTADILLGGWRRSGRAARWRTALAALLVVVALPRAWAERTTRYTVVDEIAAAVSDAATPADLVVIDPWYAAISFQRYYRGRAPWTTLPEMAGVGIHRYDLMKASMMSDAQCRPLLERIDRTLRAGHDVWLVGRLLRPPEGKTPRVFKPAPLEGVWLETAYAQSWALQVGYLIDHHAARVTERDPDSPPNPESLSLYRARGWRPSPHD